MMVAFFLIFVYSGKIWSIRIYYLANKVNLQGT